MSECKSIVIEPVQCVTTHNAEILVNINCYQIIEWDDCNKDMIGRKEHRISGERVCVSDNNMSLVFSLLLQQTIDCQLYM